MALIGGITIIIAALLAFVQNDIKKVLAYSTVSQLGYMVMALGVGAWTAAVFHIFTHAFFKALPVPRRRLGEPLGHAPLLRHEEGHGRLAQVHADTFVTFIIGTLALVGVFPLRRLLVEGRDHRQRRRARLRVRSWSSASSARS